MEPSILGQLVAKSKLTELQTRKLIKSMADQLMQDFDAPGACGATNDWVTKLVIMYPQLADPGKDMHEKTVNYHKYIINNSRQHCERG